MKTLLKTNALDSNIDASFATNGRVNPKVSGRVRSWQGASQDRLYILVDGIAGTAVRRGNPAYTLRSCARIKGLTGRSFSKLPLSHDSGRMEREIGLWVRDCEAECKLDFRVRP